MPRDLTWLTREACQDMIRQKGSITRAAKALGVSPNAITARLNPPRTSQADKKSGNGDGLSPWGYNRTATITWPDPYPPSELRKWIDAAQPGQKITAATIPWTKFPFATRKMLAKAEQSGEIQILKSKSRVEIKRL